MQIKNGTLFVISAPSGAGKTSLVNALLEQVENLEVSISHTTRQPRHGEKEGEAYFFVNEVEFKKLVTENHLLEHAKVFDHYYGTLRHQVEQKLSQGRNIILEIDWQGARQVRSELKQSIGIFILPPDYHTLRNRLVARQNDTVEVIERRMQSAHDEISHHTEFDYIVINNDFQQALVELKSIITATNLERNRQSNFYKNHVDNILLQQD